MMNTEREHGTQIGASHVTRENLGLAGPPVLRSVFAFLFLVPSFPKRTAALLALALALFTVLTPQSARADRPAGVTAQTLSMPSGPASLKGLGESFSPNISTGTGSFSVPLQLPPGFLAPSLSLGYTGGKGKGVLGQSWDLPLLEIYRSRDKGAPDFDEDDRFAVRGPGLNDELVRVNEHLGTYRLKNEGAFALFIRDAAKNQWTIRFRSGQTAFLGESSAGRQTSRGRAYRWLIERQVDRFGHWVAYHYFTDQGHVYLEEIAYQLHAASAYQNTVAFVYATRPDVFTDYSYGDRVTTALRLEQIQVLHGNRTVRRYKVGYQQSVLFSLVESVELLGEDGLSLPALHFAYLDDVHSGGLVTMNNAPPLESLLHGWGELDDVNADGLPDLIEAKAGSYRYYENLDGRNWAPVRSVSNSPDRSLNDQGTVFADINGDGFRDLMHTQGGGFRYYPGGDIAKGVFRGFGPAVDVHSNAGGFQLTDESVKMTDLNSDGRIDLIWQKPGQDSRLRNGVDNMLHEESIPELPVDVNFGDARVELSDFNGDGELDFVLKDIGWTSSRLRVWFGLGHGEYASEQQATGVPTGDPGEFHLMDVNHDGQADLVRVSGSWATYYLNRGQLRFSTARGDFHGLPATSATLKLTFADMNGNGSRDLVWITTDYRLRYLDFAGQPNPGLLTRIDNGMGLVTDISYRMSTEYAIEAKVIGKRWAYPMPLQVPVLAEVRTSDSLDVLGFEATETRTTYAYRDGYYDGKEREFRGFESVEVTDWGDASHETLATETRMHVGRNPKTGADEEVLKGRPYAQIARNGAGELYSSVETHWERRLLCQEALEIGGEPILPRCNALGPLEGKKDELVAVALSTDTLSATYEKTHTPRFTASASVHDAWGRVIEERNFGEVGYSAVYEPGGGYNTASISASLGNDEQITKTAYIDNISSWLIGIPTESKLTALDGTVYGQNRTFYDGLPYGQVSRGLITLTSAYYADEHRWIDTATHEYDPHGNKTASTNVVGDRVELEYEAHANMFPASERVEVGADDWVTFTADYDLAYGAMTQSTDPNLQTWRFVIDGLGRPKEVVDPGGALPVSKFSYTYGTAQYPISTTRVDTLVERSGRYHTAWSYSDGAGRARQTKEAAEAPHGYIASSWTRLSSRGQPIEVYDPFATPVLGLQPPPPGTPYSSSQLDAMGRATLVDKPPTEDLPTRSVVLTQYLPFETRAYTEKESTRGDLSNPEFRRLDGLGRVVEVEKYNTSGGELQRLRWRIGYNTRGDITTFADPQWNGQPTDLRHLRRYSYDSLGRLVTVADPNAGRTDYTFDDLGRLVKRVDALAQVQEWVYGRAGRLLRHQVGSSASGAPGYEHAYHYDEPASQSPLIASASANLRGKLAWVAFPTGQMHAAYDELGRLREEVQRLWDPAKSALEPDVCQLGSEPPACDDFRREIDYRADGAVTQVRAPGGLVLDHGYNERGGLTSLKAQAGSVARPILTGATFDHRGAVLSTSAGNGIVTCSSYNARAELTGFLAGRATDVSCNDVGRPGRGFHHLAYQRSYDGMIDAVRDLSDTSTGLARLDASYAYDSIHQLESVTDARGTVTFGYDAIQNLVRQEVAGSIRNLPTGAFGYGEDGAGPSAITSAGGETYDYDAAGQMLRYNGYDLHFDAEGRLVEASNPSRGVRLVQHFDDAGERRIALVYRTGKPVEVHRFVAPDYQQRDGEEIWFADGGPVGAEIVRSKGVKVDAYLLDQLTEYVNAAQTKRKPLPEEYMDLNGDGKRLDVEDLALAQQGFAREERVGGEKLVFRYVTTDHLGGTTHLTDSAGDLVSHQRYEAYGKVASRTGQKAHQGYIGADVEPDEDLGLQRLGARYYAPAMGRWVTPDPLIGQAPGLMVERVLESNLYSYARNNPVMGKDPTGTMNWDSVLWASDPSDMNSYDVSSAKPGNASETMSNPSQNNPNHINLSGQQIADQLIANLAKDGDKLKFVIDGKNVSISTRIGNTSVVLSNISNPIEAIKGANEKVFSVLRDVINAKDISHVTIASIARVPPKDAPNDPHRFENYNNPGGGRGLDITLMISRDGRKALFQDKPIRDENGSEKDQWGERVRKGPVNPESSLARDIRMYLEGHPDTNQVLTPWKMMRQKGVSSVDNGWRNRIYTPGDLDWWHNNHLHIGISP